MLRGGGGYNSRPLHYRNLKDFLLMVNIVIAMKNEGSIILKFYENASQKESK